VRNLFLCRPGVSAPFEIAKRPGVRHSCAALALNQFVAHWLTSLPAYLLAFACLTGCTSMTTGTSSSIDQLHLLVTSVALDLDGKPGPDGIGVRVYASHTGSSEAVPVKTGTLELLMYDGAHVREQLASLQPRHVWTYPADQLKAYLQKTSIGTSYRFAALWGEDKPASDRVTLIARYTRPDGTQIYSAPSSIPVAK
jgi:hypothetical protein